MSFLDPAFLFCFLPLALFCFAVAGKFWGPSGGNAVLILATLVFCLPYGWPFLILVVVSALLNYAAYAVLVRPAETQSVGRRFGVFLGAMIFNFALLCVFKYGVLFEALPGAKPVLAMLAGAIPATISFFTFQRAVMLLDAYQQRPETSALVRGGAAGRLRFGAFNLMFPNLIIGPIAYVSELGVQLSRSSFGKLRRIDVEVGLTLLVIGLAKKTLIADPLDANIVSPLFSAVSAGQKIVPIEAVMGMVGYYAQLYFDFSGYSDIALGIARLFGLILPLNFNSPLRATGVIDFWRRWHITLTRVIAKFMFTPLAVAGTRLAARHRLRGWRAKALATWLPVLINFEVIGLWHGARATFIAFGLFHGLWFILESEIRSAKRWKAFAKRTTPGLRQRLGQAVTFVPMVVSFAIFRSASLTDFTHLMASLGNDWLAVLSDSRGRILNSKLPLLYLVVAFAVIWLTPNAYELLRNYRPGIVTFTVPSTTPRLMRLAWRPTLFWALLVMALALVVVATLNAPTPFVYGGF